MVKLFGLGVKEGMKYLQVRIHTIFLLFLSCPTRYHPHLCPQKSSRPPRIRALVGTQGQDKRFNAQVMDYQVPGTPVIVAQAR